MNRQACFLVWRGADVCLLGEVGASHLHSLLPCLPVRGRNGGILFVFGLLLPLPTFPYALLSGGGVCPNLVLAPTFLFSPKLTTLPPILSHHCCMSTCSLLSLLPSYPLSSPRIIPHPAFYHVVMGEEPATPCKTLH